MKKFLIAMLIAVGMLAAPLSASAGATVGSTPTAQTTSTSVSVPTLAAYDDANYGGTGRFINRPGYADCDRTGYLIDLPYSTTIRASSLKQVTNRCNYVVLLAYTGAGFIRCGSGYLNMPYVGNFCNDNISRVHIMYR